MDLYFTWKAVLIKMKRSERLYRAVGVVCGHIPAFGNEVKEKQRHVIRILSTSSCDATLIVNIS